MDTFELLPSLAQGELAESSAAELVAAVFRSRASGTLSIESPDGTEIRVFFRGGEMCGTGAFSGFRTLAVVLLENDWVNALDIDSSRAEAAALRKRHGEILVGKGILTPEQLKHALFAQHRQNLATLLALPAGRYEWRGFEPPPPWARDVLVDPVGCIVEALEPAERKPRRQRVLDWLGGFPARLSVDWPELSGRIVLGPQDRRAAALLALPRRLAEFVSASKLGQSRAEAVLVTLLLAGAVEAHPVGQPDAPITESPQPLPARPRQPGDLPPEVMEDAEAAQLLPESFELQPPPVPDEGLLADLPQDSLGESIDPHVDFSGTGFAAAQVGSFELDLAAAPAEPLELADAPAEPLELADAPAEPLELADAPAPQLPQDDLGFDGGAEDPLQGLTALPVLEDGASSRALELAASAEQESQQGGRDLRKRMMMQGMRNLRSAPPPAPASPHQRIPSNPAVRFVLDESRLGPEEQRFVDEVRSNIKQAKTQSAYVRLGISQASTSEQIKAAYITAAKRYHPDRSAAPGLAALQPELQALFGTLKEAYDLVATSDLRVRYDEALKQGKGSSRKEDAALYLKMGEVLLKKRDFEGALAKLRRTVELEPTGDALAALSWALVCDPRQPPAGKEEAASLINRALRSPGCSARTYYVAGVLWRSKDPESAADAFRKAVELEPGHPDASLELRLLESRRKGKSTGAGVLSGLLFGKRKQ